MNNKTKSSSLASILIEWENENESSHRKGENDNQIEIQSLYGSIWGDFGKENPAKNTLLFQGELSGAQENIENSITIKVQNDATVFGEQAGIVLYSLERQSWIKLVLEGMKDGSLALVVASQMENAGPKVLHKVASDSSTQILKLSVQYHMLPYPISAFDTDSVAPPFYLITCYSLSSSCP